MGEFEEEGASRFEIGERVRGGRVVFIDARFVYVLGPSGVLSVLKPSAVDAPMREEGAERLGQIGRALVARGAHNPRRRKRRASAGDSACPRRAA